MKRSSEQAVGSLSPTKTILFQQIIETGVILGSGQRKAWFQTIRIGPERDADGVWEGAVLAGRRRRSCEPDVVVE
jgi:hypothetical protein